MEQEKTCTPAFPLRCLRRRSKYADHIGVDEPVRDAMERRLRERRRQNLYAYGEQQARKLGIKEEDVDRSIHEFRQEERERQNNTQRR